MMTPHKIELARALGGIAGWVGARFCMDVAYKANSSPESELTPRQRYYIEIMAWRYRRQLAPHLVPETKPLGAPPRRANHHHKKNVPLLGS